MKKFSIAAMIALFILLTAVGLVACNIPDAEAETRVTSVQIKDTRIYMSPYGEPSVFQLEPWVMPSDARNKGLTYKVLDYEDREHLTVDSNGKITAILEKKEGTATIRITSTDNPDAYLDVHVAIEIVPVKKISFIPTQLNLLLGDEPTPIKPIFSPYHAILGRNVTYKSLNENVAVVDSEGNIRAVGVGKTTVWVTASNDQNISEDELVKGNLQIAVNYTPPNYKLSIANPALSCKQIVGATTQITLSLDKMDATCDPSPTIRWRVAGAPIPKTEDYKNISFNPNDLPRGVYNIQATITDAGSQTQLLYSEDIYMYEKLTGIDIMVYNSKEDLEKLSVNDILRMEASFSQDQYPPDNYKWTVYRNGQFYETRTLAVKTFNYKVKDTGEYTFTCEAIIQGRNSGISKTSQVFTAGAAKIGNDIYNVYVTAQKFNTQILPYITWDPLYYNAEYTVTIETSNKDVHTFSSENSNDKAYFKQNGMFVPPNIATLSDSFSVTLQSAKYGWTDTVNYNGNIVITNEDMQFFDIIVGDFDGYIHNIEEMGKLLNYINIFRPESIKEGDWYKAKLKVPFTYSSLSSVTYPLPTGSPIVDEDLQDIMNIIVAAFNCYGDSAVYTPSALYDPETSVLELGIKFEAEDDEMTATDPSVNSRYTNENVILHYASSPRTNDVLPIDSLKVSMSVSTSMQLYYAVSLGYKPVPVAGSAADSIYKEARKVAARIINDDMNEAQKVHAIYDFLTVETIYDRWLASQDLSVNPNIVYESFHLEGVFNAKLAVCDGIAKAFTLLCGMEGIASVKVNGVAGAVGHAWNKVLVEGAWYVTDATWGSYLSGNIELQTHRYLLTTDATIQSTHTPYGKQHITKAERHPVYYNDTILSNYDYDATIDNSEELTALVQYINDKLNAATTSIWFDFVLSNIYYESLNNNVNSGIATVVSEALAGFTGIRYSIEVTTGSKFAAIRLEKK